MKRVIYRRKTSEAQEKNCASLVFMLFQPITDRKEEMIVSSVRSAVAGDKFS